MNIEDIRQKYQCDASQTFAQWKEWVRKNKPSQAQAHIVKAVAPNGSKYERLIGGYTDAQNAAFDLVSHGYKDVKLYHSVNAGPLKLLRNFSAPLHGAKFKDSVDAVDSIREKYQSDAVGAGVVNPNFKFQTNVEKRLATTRKGRAMTLPQYGKPSKVIVKKDGNSFSVIGKDGQKLNKNTFKSYEEAEKWARGNGWMVERR